MEDHLNKIVEFLKNEAGKDDMASVQINSEGICIFRVGITYSEHLTINEFVSLMEQQ